MTEAVKTGSALKSSITGRDAKKAELAIEILLENKKRNTQIVKKNDLCEVIVHSFKISMKFIGTSSLEGLHLRISVFLAVKYKLMIRNSSTNFQIMIAS